eukprot:gene18152-23429_t
MIAAHGEDWRNNCYTRECETAAIELEDLEFAATQLSAGQVDALDGNMEKFGNLFGLDDDGYGYEPAYVEGDWDIYESVTTNEDGQSIGHEVNGDAIKGNVVKIQFYYAALSLEKYEESPLLTPTGLVASIAGLVGLWLGFSVSTMLEWVEFLLVFGYKRPSLSDA